MGEGKDLWHQLETLVNKHDHAGFASLFAPDGTNLDPGRPLGLMPT